MKCLNRPLTASYFLAGFMLEKLLKGVSNVYLYDSKVPNILKLDALKECVLLAPDLCEFLAEFMAHFGAIFLLKLPIVSRSLTIILKVKGNAVSDVVDLPRYKQVDIFVYHKAGSRLGSFAIETSGKQMALLSKGKERAAKEARDEHRSLSRLLSSVISVAKRENVLINIVSNDVPESAVSSSTALLEIGLQTYCSIFHFFQ